MVVNLIIFNMPNFDMIMGIDFLSWYRVKIDYIKKKVWFHLKDGKEFTFGEDCMLSMIIKNIKARKILSKGCTSYLVYVVNRSYEATLNL